jgi:hypothetical protein
MPPLYNDIEIEIQAGHLEPYWTTSDLIDNNALTNRYRDGALRTDPPNRSISAPGQNLGTGYNVNPNNPVYLRVGRRGRALLYCLPGHL